MLVLLFLLLATENYGTSGYIAITLCLMATGGICVLASKDWLFTCIKVDVSYEIEKVEDVVEAEVPVEAEAD